MKTTMSRLAVAALGASLIAAGAHAATPASGTLGKASPKIKYTGSFTAEEAYPYYAAWQHDPSIDCGDSCDKYALTVTDPGKIALKFELGAVGDTGNGFIGVKIEHPDGTFTYERGESAPKEPFPVTIAAAKAGAYEISLAANFICCGDQTVLATGDWTDPNAPPPADPTPTPSGGGGTTPAPSQPAAPQEFTVGAKVGKVSAKKAKKGKTISVKASSSRAIERMTLTLKKGSKKVGSATLAPFPGSATMKVKLSSALKKGSYSLVVAGTDGSKTNSKVVKVKVAK